MQQQQQQCEQGRSNMLQIESDVVTTPRNSNEVNINVPYEDFTIMKEDVQMASEMQEAPGSSFFNHALYRECACEFLATCVLLVFGNGVNLMVLLSNNEAVDNAHGTWLSINLCWAIGIMMCLYICGGITGGHVNPAVSFAFATVGKLPWKKVPFYALSQIAGAFCGAALAYSLYWETIDIVGYTSETAEMFAPIPKDQVSNAMAFWTECLATIIMTTTLAAIEDERNFAANRATKPIIVGLMIAAIGMCFGFNTGYALNPARDFGPRLFTSLAGWGSNPFRYHNSWFWIPLTAPVVGSTAGLWIYRLFVESMHPVAVAKAVKMPSGYEA